MHIENDDIFVALSHIWLQPTGCLSSTTEEEDSSSLGNSILFEWWHIYFPKTRTGMGSLTQASLYPFCILSFYESGSQLLILSSHTHNC